MRARELGIAIGTGTPGPLNAITDVAGVQVGHETIAAGPARTGVTIVNPTPAPWDDLIFAGAHRLNGNGEMTGLEWVRESGQLTSPIGLTNTHSVGVVRDALVAHEIRSRPAGPREVWALPVVAETWDGVLNDVNGFHVGPEHVERALAALSGGPVAEGAIGGGTGMICHGFKGGIWTASRILGAADGGFTVGVLVQANHGRRARLSVEGAPVGRAIGPEVVPLPDSVTTEGLGSIIGIVATDAPLLPTGCDRLAQRAALGVARTGGVGEHGSGDLFLCFSTANAGRRPAPGAGPARVAVDTLLGDAVNPLFDAVVEATEEAIVGALLAAETMTGFEGRTAHALPGALLRETLARLAPESFGA